MTIHELLADVLAKELRIFLGENLPKIADDWWDKCVVPSIGETALRSFIEDGREKNLNALDTYALLKIFNYHFFKFCQKGLVPLKAKALGAEVFIFRNSQAHKIVGTDNLIDNYRGVDTIYRFLSAIKCQKSVLEEVDLLRKELLTETRIDNTIEKTSWIERIKTAHKLKMISIGILVIFIGFLTFYQTTGVTNQTSTNPTPPITPSPDYYKAPLPNYFKVTSAYITFSTQTYEEIGKKNNNKFNVNLTIESPRYKDQKIESTLKLAAFDRTGNSLPKLQGVKIDLDAQIYIKVEKKKLFLDKNLSFGKDKAPEPISTTNTTQTFATPYWTLTLQGKFE